MTRRREPRANRGGTYSPEATAGAEFLGGRRWQLAYLWTNKRASVT